MTKKKKTKQPKQWLLPFIVFALIVITIGYFYVTKEDITIVNVGDLDDVKVVRNPSAAGTFYPATANGIDNMFGNYFAVAPEMNISGIKALVVPHAGYIYSGLTAAAGYNQLGNDYKTVFILADNHNPAARFDGISILPVTHYKVPTGEVKVSSIAKTILNDTRLRGIARTVYDAHKTHVIEVQLPFLDRTLDDFEIVPIIFGSISDKDREAVQEVIKEHLGPDTLIVVSTDLSHYHKYDNAVTMDNSCIKDIEAVDIQNAKRCELCGPSSMMTLLSIAKDKGWTGKIADYRNSGDTAGSKDSVVGYSSIVFSEERSGLSPEEKKMLLMIAKDSVEAAVNDNKRYDPDKETLSKYPSLLEKKAAFVTLKIDGMLRGCIGHLEPVEPLYLSVRNNAIAAAMKDSRFKPISKSELQSLEYSISVLEIPKLQDVASDVFYNALREGIDGVILEKSVSQRSTYLPVVWEQIPDKDDFLTQLCRKGNMDDDCWRDPDVKKYIYASVEWSEEVLE